MSNVAFCGLGVMGGPMARHLKAKGHEVSGSDQNTYPPMSTLLASQGITVKTPYDAAHLEPAPDLIIVGNAISRGNPEAEAVLARGLPHLSMPQALERFFLQDKIPLVVAGTHGQSGVQEALVGSVAEGLLKSLSCDVLAVPIGR